MTTTNSAKPPVYVLWFGITGLSVARALGRAGIEVVGLHDDPNDPCVATRYARSVTLPPIERDERAWVEWLVAEGRRLEPRKAVLLPAADAHWLMVARHRVVLERHFHIAMPRGGDLQEWIGKPFQYAACARAGVPFPHTLTANSMLDVENAIKQTEFPCLVKPVLSHLWQRAYGGKLAFVRTPADLRARAADALNRGLAIMIQEYIPARDDEIYGVFVCVDRQSRPLGYCVARKLRQCEPRFGNSSMSVCVDEPRVVELGLRLVRELGYHGIGSAEFKRDPRDGEFKFMEFNLRPTSLMRVAFDSGVNLPLLLHQELCGEQVNGVAPEPVTPERFGRRVGHLAADVSVARYYRQAERIGYFKWARSWIGATDIYFAWDDLRPWVRSLHLFFIKVGRGVYRRFPPTFPTLEEWHAGRWEAGSLPSTLPAPPDGAL
jgi:predicted ATP-grasp superfamily ATP-dependent carboligase